MRRDRLLQPNSQLVVMRLFILLDLEAALQYPAHRTAPNFFGKDCPVQQFQNINQLNLPYRLTLWGTGSGGSRKFWWGGGFEAQNLKNSDVFTKIESDFSAEIGNSNVFFAQIQVVSKKENKKKKKGLHQN